MVGINLAKLDDPEVGKNTCPNCGGSGGRDCGHGVYDEWNGDYDCDRDDESECPCELTFCDKCLKEFNDG